MVFSIHNFKNIGRQVGVALIELGIVDIVNIQNIGSGLMWSTGNVGWVARLALKVQIPNALSRSTLRQKYNWE